MGMLLNRKWLAAASGLLLGVAGPAGADTVGLRTTKVVGQTLTLALNNGVEAVLDWGDGNTSEIVFTGFLQEIPVLGDSLQIKTTNAVTSLYCAGNELVTLNLTSARSLEMLVCNDNALTRLDLYSNRSLTAVNCQRNALTYLRVRYCTGLESLNCAQNPLGALDLGRSLTALTSLICAENGLETLDVSGLTALEVLWCQNNKLEKLNLTKNVALQQLYAFSNRLAQLDLSALTELEELYVDDNQLETLDVSSLVKLKTISVDRNRLTSLNTTVRNRNALLHFYAHNNNLAYNSFPTVYSTAGGGRDMLDKYCVAPQNELPLVPAVSVGEALDLSALINKNAWGTTVAHVLVWKQAESGAELALDEDVSLTKKGIYTFLKPVGDVYAEITAPTYPGLTLRTSAVKVMTDATPVGTVQADVCRITTEQGALVVTADAPLRVTAVAADGRLVVNQMVPQGVCRWNLPAGVYMVNGRKVLIGR